MLQQLCSLNATRSDVSFCHICSTNLSVKHSMSLCKLFASCTEQYLLHLSCDFHQVCPPAFFSPQTFPSGNSSMLFVGADVGGVSHATLPPCSSVLVCPCLACPPLHLPPAVSFLRASSSEPKQQFHLFCQGWECTQPSLAVFLPAPLDAKPVDLTHMPALLFLLLSFTLSA